MKRVLVKSVYSAFDYVMEHYYPKGLKQMRNVKIHMQLFLFRILTQEDLDLFFQKVIFAKGY